MTWLGFALLGVVFVSITTIFQKILMSHTDSNPSTCGILYHLLLGVVHFLCASMMGVSIDFSQGSLSFVFLAALLWSLTTVYFFKAIQLIQPAEVTIISTFQVLVVILASVLFLGEVFDIYMIFGALIIILGSCIVLRFKDGFHLNRGVLYTLMLSLFAGLAVVVDSINVQHYNVILYGTIINFLSAFMLWGFYPRAMIKWKKYIKIDYIQNLLVVVVFSMIQGVLFLQALSFGGVTGQIATIRQASIVLTVVLSVVFLKDRERLMQKSIAGVLVTWGVMLLS
jgi:uncharacterized membrane protein